MTSTSDHAELSMLRSVLDDLVTRIVAISDRYRDSEDSAVAADLDGAERAMLTARRAVDRSLETLRSMP
ncbi:MAG: hypothetical protein RL531_663 [Actinomycetota bacterium]|jgi:hypothetical protein